jgi:DNA-binding MurR/RpiR family transcriptional regulator
MARSTDTILARVKAALPHLHPSERRIAEVVLSFPGQLASYTGSELAQLSNVSNATVSRFVRRIGYGSYEEARQAARAEQSAGAPLFRFGAGGAALDGAVAPHAEQSRANLDATFARLEEPAIDAIAEAALAARRVHVIGFRAGQPMARYVAWQMSQVLPSVATLPRDGETVAESVTGLPEDDCVLVVALRRPPAILEPLLGLLAEGAAPVALIGDLPELDRMPARWRISCVTNAPGPLLNHVSVMAVCNLLAARIIELSGAEGRRRIGAVEDAHLHLGEL